MSELKAIHAYTFDEVEVISTHSNGNDYYLKSEADEELAKLDRQVKFLQTTHSSCNYCNKCADGIGRVFDEYLDKLKKENADLLKHNKKVINSQERVIHRQKYKRCRAMMMWCASRAVTLSQYGNEKDSDWFWKWKDKWKKLAEQFKEDK